MKKVIIITTILIMVCAGLSAQTFDKVIQVSDSADKVWIVEVLESNNIILVGNSENNPKFPSRSKGFVYKLDASGSILDSTIIAPDDLLAGLSQNNQLVQLRTGVNDKLNNTMYPPDQLHLF